MFNSHPNLQELVVELKRLWKMLEIYIKTNKRRILVGRLSQQLNVSVGTCHKILSEDLEMYLYKVQTSQELIPSD